MAHWNGWIAAVWLLGGCGALAEGSGSEGTDSDSASEGFGFGFEDDGEDSETGSGEPEANPGGDAVDLEGSGCERHGVVRECHPPCTRTRMGS